MYYMQNLADRQTHTHTHRAESQLWGQEGSSGRTYKKQDYENAVKNALDVKVNKQQIAHVTDSQLLRGLSWRVGVEGSFSRVGGLVVVVVCGAALWLQLFWHVWKFLETNVIKTTRNTYKHTHTLARFACAHTQSAWLFY